MIHYLDTSAALKLLIEEPESHSVASHLDQVVGDGHDLISSMLLFTELHCAAGRRGTLDAHAVNSVLEGVTLLDLQRTDLMRAGTSAWGLRSADSIHLAVALRLEADALITYDVELAAAASRAGLQVQSPQARPST